MATHIIGEFVVIETLSSRHCVSKHLPRRITVWNKIITERIYSLSFCPLLIFLKQILDARKVHCRYGHKDFGIVYVSVHQRTHQYLQRRSQHPDQCAAHNTRSESSLVGGANESHGIRWIGSRENDIGIGGLDRTYDWRQVSHRRRIKLIVHNGKPGRLGICTGAILSLIHISE